MLIEDDLSSSGLNAAVPSPTYSRIAARSCSRAKRFTCSAWSRAFQSIRALSSARLGPASFSAHAPGRQSLRSFTSSGGSESAAKSEGWGGLPIMVTRCIPS